VFLSLFVDMPISVFLSLFVDMPISVFLSLFVDMPISAVLSAPLHNVRDSSYGDSMVYRSTLMARLLRSNNQSLRAAHWPL
jgi:hypothetical protein